MLKLTQHEPLGFSANCAQLSASWSTPRTPAYAADTASVPNSRRSPTFHWYDFGTFTSLSMSQASGAPTLCTSASRVALSAVKYESLQSTWPGPGVVEPGGAKFTVNVG